METLDRDTAKNLFDHYRKNRDGIRNKPEMASVCLICGSIHIILKVSSEHKLVCRDCGFAFFRYAVLPAGTWLTGATRGTRAAGNAACGSAAAEPAAVHRDNGTNGVFPGGFIAR